MSNSGCNVANNNSKLASLLILIIIVVFLAVLSEARRGQHGNNGRQNGRLEAPIVINTWNFRSASERAWQELKANHSALDAIEFGCGQCEIDRCDGTVGWGGSPSESGETTLDAMIMDGETYNVGGVGGLRRIKNAIGVARQVLELTNHSLLVGEMATQFAIELGFKEESLTSDESRKIHQDWLDSSCQPNYWMGVVPDPRKNCGPYERDNGTRQRAQADNSSGGGDEQQPPTRDHDTIGMVAIDSRGRIAAGTSTNGLNHKILGRVGDSPVPGAGSYAAKEAGAAAATGDGDVMMRFLLTYQAVENLRQGMGAQKAASDSIRRMMSRTGKPYAMAGLIVLALDGSYGVACTGMDKFPYVISDSRKQVQVLETKCFN